MDAFKSILVDVDAAAAVHPALDRAARLARRSGATVTVADVIAGRPIDERYGPVADEEARVARTRQQLERIARTVPGVRTHVRLLAGRPSGALVSEVVDGRHDLLVRSRVREGLAVDETNVELLRACPCPVLLVQHGALSERPRIAGAVDASAEHGPEAALNREIVRLTCLMAELEDGVPVLLQAWEPFAERKVRGHASADDFAAYVETVRARTAGALAELARLCGDRFAEMPGIYRRGEPEDVIPAFAVEQGVDLVVMGNAARRGLAGFFIGNTVERVLATIPCSILAVKPAVSDGSSP